MLKDKTTFWFLKFVSRQSWCFRPMPNTVAIHHEYPFRMVDCSDAFRSSVIGAVFLLFSEAGIASRRTGTNRFRFQLKCRFPELLRILQTHSHGREASQNFLIRQQVMKRQGMLLHTRAMVKRRLNCATKDNLFVNESAFLVKVIREELVTYSNCTSYQ